MLMFTTGLGTNLKELIKAGPIATPVSYTHLSKPRKWSMRTTS